MEDRPLTSLSGVGEAVARKFAVLGIRTIDDLIRAVPRRYEDYSHVVPIARLKPGTVSVQAKIQQATGRYVRRGMHITEAVATDGTASVRLVWFNQPYRAAALKVDQEHFISGQYELSRQRFAIMNPSAELASDFPVNAARILPVYRETRGLTSKQIRKVLAAALPFIRALPETLPEWLVQSQRLMSRAQAIEVLHFPPDSQQLAAAQRRLGFEEVFELTLAALLNKYDMLQDEAPAVPFRQDLAQTFVAALPFTLTNAQRKVVWQIYQDMQRTQPMNRLVEGDVGSGKTVVAAMAALMALDAGYQVALMAPTELLARQHADTLYDLFRAEHGRESQVALLVGGLKPAEKTQARERIAAGDARLIVGTHALVQDSVDMHQLGLVVIDEQHRFGVEQRKKLLSKAGHMPHVLSLTATPIPRSLALTLYGELDVSILDAKPAGRQPVETQICSPNSREPMYKKIEQELQAGRQLFVVCPLITESTALQASSAEKVYEQFRTRDFKQWRVGLLHGKMKPADKQAVMQQFANHELDILVSTTVIEVGVDVPNASVMLIEAAERFGLAQIHQLRGRVGRGGHRGYCFLMMSDSKAPPKRLQALERSNDGFKLAELDLELRGPGAIYGTLQHGELDLRIAKLSDTKLIATARQAAQKFIDHQERLMDYPELARRVTGVRAVTHLN